MAPKEKNKVVKTEILNVRSMLRHTSLSLYKGSRETKKLPISNLINGAIINNKTRAPKKVSVK